MACSNSEGRVWSNNTKSSLRSHSECSGADAAAAQGPSSSSRSSGSPSTIDTGSEPEIGLAEEQDSPEEAEEYVAAPIKAAASSHAQVPSRVHRSRIVESSSSSLSPEEDVYPANRDRQRNAGRAAAQPGRTNAAHESGALHASSSKTKLPEKPRIQKAAAGSNARRQKRTKENINAKEIEQVLGEAPVRMTRSMARKTGVQPTRRYYGEGVSASQIIRPLKPASKGQ
ncbi:hypothetical protein GQ54DRAFT_303379 [Martensiomyces pterosporus]|nr:hypothetical protein GQ54DRAFT_303379 [Martensiomyces pterosporus]